MIVAALTPTFASFILFFAFGVSFLVTSVGVLFIAIMASAPEHLRGQAMAVAQLIRLI